MKKLFTLLLCSSIVAVHAQNISVYKTNNLGTPTFTFTNGSSYDETSAPNAEIATKMLIKNITANTNTYTVYRSIVFNSPALDVTATQNIPYTKFCFGNTCFPGNVSTPPTSYDYTILGPAGSTSSPYDNSNQNGNTFILYLEEGPSMGKYFVRYKVQNVNNANDTLSFTIKYNEFMGVNELASTIESVDVYPNPSSNNAAISVDMKSENDVKIQVYNSLGSVVYTAPAQKYSAGKHKLSVDCSSFNAGLYFISVTAGDNKVTKRFVLNK